MPRRTRVERVEDIVSAIERIAEYTEALDFSTFAQDQKTIDAVVPLAQGLVRPDPIRRRPRHLFGALLADRDAQLGR